MVDRQSMDNQLFRIALNLNVWAFQILIKLLEEIVHYFGKQFNEKTDIILLFVNMTLCQHLFGLA